MFSLIRDLVHAARTLLRAKAFTAVCVTSLGVGMSVVIGILLMTRFILSKPSGVNDEGLVEIVIRPSGPLKAEAGSAIIDTWSYPDYLDVRDAASGMVMIGWSRGEGLVRLPDQSADYPLSTMYVSSNYFSTVGVTLARGRGFTPADDGSRAEAEVVISQRAWQLRFGSDPNVIGRAINVNGSDYVVVGVAPERFRGHVGGLDDAYYYLWLPLSHHPRLATQNVRLSRDARFVRILGRLNPGTTLAQADGVVHSTMAALATRYPASNQDKAGGVEEYFPSGARERSQITSARMVMFGLAGMVLLVVGLNISGMMLVRSAMRERELAIRLAIGATRWRLMRYHLSEALVMALWGGGFASALLFGVPAIVAWAYDYTGPAMDLFKPDVWVVLQCIALCFATSLVLGLLPALRFSRPGILLALKNDASGSGRRVGRLQRLTAAVQAGLAVPFLVMGAVKVDQARVTAMADVGFKPQGLYAARVNISSIGKTDEDRDRLMRSVRDDLAQSPGVQSVSVGDGVPLDFNYRNARVALEGSSTFADAHTTRVGPGYFDTVGIRVLAGRAIDANDRAGAERVVMLSEPLARELFPAGDPLAKRVVFTLAGDEPQTYTIVGVTADLVSTQMGNPRPQLFVSLAQNPALSVLAIARGAAADPSVRRAFEQALGEAHRQVSTQGQPDFVLRELITGEGLIQGNHEDLLTHSVVSGGAAMVALVLAALGVYGVIAFMVAMRTREIGLRMALGASRARVVWDVLGDALKLVVPGIGLGLVSAVLWVRMVDPSWYPLGGVEPLIYFLAAATAFIVSALAGLPSARRAAAVQPIVAMRAE